MSNKRKLGVQRRKRPSVRQLRQMESEAAEVAARAEEQRVARAQRAADMQLQERVKGMGLVVPQPRLLVPRADRG